MKFTNKIKTNWHDTDANRNVRAGKIVEYMQETANAQCEFSGLPLEKLRDEKGLAFILGAISLRIHTPLHAYEEIEVKTWCQEARGYIFNRYFEIVRNGTLIAEASSTWVLIDINKKNMVRADSCDFMKDRFYYDDPIDPASLPPRARIPKDTSLYAVGERKISYSDIDYNMHMNNTHYPDMICDFIEEMVSSSPTYRVSALSLSYLKESHLGATLSVTRSATDPSGTLFIRTLNKNGETCLEAIVTLEASEI